MNTSTKLLLAVLFIAGLVSTISTALYVFTADPMGPRYNVETKSIDESGFSAIGFDVFESIDADSPVCRIPALSMYTVGDVEGLPAGWSHVSWGGCAGVAEAGQ